MQVVPISTSERAEGPVHTRFVGGEASAKFDAVVRHLAANAVAVGELLFFLCELHTGAIMDFVPGETTTAQVVFQAIIPLTARSGTSFAALLHGDGECHPDAMISHAWGNQFSFLVAAVVAYAVGEPLYYTFVPRLRSLEGTQTLISEIAEKSHGALSKKVWLCIFGVNQHVSICRCHKLKFLNGDPLCQMDKFDAMLQFMHSRAEGCFQQVIALGVAGLALSRAWVVSEVATCLSLGMVQCARIRFPLTLGDEELRAAIRTLDVRKCSASRPEDKDAILSAIKDKDAYNHDVKKIVAEAAGLRDDLQKYQGLNAVALWVVVTAGICALVLAYFRNPVAEKAAVLVALLCSMPFLMAFAWFRLKYQFIFPALQDADRHGLCHETFAEIPRGPWWSLPSAHAWRRIAAACHAAPGRWQRLGGKIHAVCMFWYILSGALWVCNGLDGPGGAWTVIAGYAGLTLAAAFGNFSRGMIWRSDYPKSFKRFVLVPLLVAVWLTVPVFVEFFFGRCIWARAFLWSLNARERVLLVAAFALNSLRLCQHCLFQLWQACCPAPESRHFCRSAEITQMGDRVHRGVAAWTRTTLRVSNLSRDLREGDLEQLCREYGPLIGTFLALDSNMNSMGTATVTFENEADAATAIKDLLGPTCRDSAMRVQWASQPRS